MIQFPLVWLITVLATIAAATLAQYSAVPSKARLLLCGLVSNLLVLAVRNSDPATQQHDQEESG